MRERVHAFMQARLTRNDTRVRTFLAAAYHRRYANEDPTTLIGDSEPHYHRYRLLGLTQIGAEAWRATVRIEIHARGFYPIGWITEEIDLAPMQGEWQVTRVTRLETHTYTDTAR
ncbi:MAG TPA: hypothetical protein GXZ82_08375 [Firmicutes bacterium]|nr:hypothetical protein [Bacillota bacterium]